MSKGSRVSPTSRYDLIEQVIEAERFIVGQQFAAALPNWVQLELTMAQLKTLVVLAEAGAPAVGDVAARLGVTLPTASHLIERLVQAGLAERTEDPHDRRRALVRLSPAGDDLLRGLRHG